MRRTVGWMLAVSLLASACGGSGSESSDDAGGEGSAPTTADATSGPTTSSDDAATGATQTTTASPSTTVARAADTTSPTTTSTAPAAATPAPSEEIERVDWLTTANGVVISSFAGDDNVAASDAIRAIDGAENQIGVSRDTSGPATYVFELPAATTFDRFAVPDARNSPGNTTFFGHIVVEGSAQSATDGFETLVDADFAELPDDVLAAEFTPAVSTPVRWIRLTLSGALVVEPEHEPGRTVVRFSELIGNGTQEVVPLSTGFTGRWSLRFADNPDGSGEATELRQEGAVVSGCIGFADVTGTVTGNVLRLNGVDTRDERPSVYLFTVADDGVLRGVESTRGGVFRARLGVAVDDDTRCSDEPPVALACGSVVYVNFDLDSDAIRPDSEPVLDDLFTALNAITDGRQITIVGHTSTEGSDEYNQDLSERRAASVLRALAGRGLDATNVASEGRGETQPLVSETDEASRSVNRRVEVACL